MNDSYKTEHINSLSSNDRKPKFFYGYVIVLAAASTLFAFSMSRSTFGVFFKPIVNEFGWSSAALSSVFSLSMVIEGILIILIGRLTDRFGPRIIVIFCGLISSLGFFLMSQIDAIWQMYLLYGVVIAIGLSGLIIPGITAVTRWFTTRRGLMTAIAFNGGNLGILISPPLATWLISNYGWQKSYIVLSVSILVITALSALFLRRDPADMREMPYGKRTSEEEASKTDTKSLSLKKAIHTWQFWFLFSVFLCYGYFGFAIGIHLIPYLIETGISAFTAASILATVGAAGIVGRLTAGIIADKIGNKRTLVLSFIPIIAALFWLLSSENIWALYLFAIVFGLGQGGAGTTQPPIIAELFGLRSYGLIFGASNFGLTIGSAFGPLISGYIFDFSGSYKFAFILCAAIAIVGLIFSSLLKPLSAKKQ